jgi:hypothetical protein
MSYTAGRYVPFVLKFVEKKYRQNKILWYTKKVKYAPIKVPVGVYRACFGYWFTIWGI